ncbi:MAG: hypothetical protein VYC34_12640, partial [Planctomycetota bacterium]|nr:hypothetical protein [Planctomycetota bacterium]
MTTPASRAPLEPRAAPTSERLLAALAAAAFIAVLIVAATLTPSPDGHGTHTRLGLTPCPWVLTLNKPCPTCGMTTAFAHAADGQL